MSAWVGSVSVFLLGLASGVSFSHLLQLGPKKTLPPEQFLAVQQVLLRNYGAVIGGLEAAALISTLAWTVTYLGEARSAHSRQRRIRLCKEPAASTEKEPAGSATKQETKPKKKDKPKGIQGKTGTESWDED